MTHCELVKLMKWKLARGKFRPRLVQLVSSNEEIFVEQCTRSGIELATTDLSEGLTMLCELTVGVLYISYCN